MWIKIVQTRFNNQTIEVASWLSDTNDDGNEVVKTQSMVNEYYLIEETIFPNRDAAYDYVKHYSPSMAKAFLNRTAYLEGAMG